MRKRANHITDNGEIVYASSLFEHCSGENHERRKSDDSCGNFLIRSVLIAVFEGGVFGAAALVFSVLTSAALQTGETEKAKVYSRRTTLFCWIGLAAGIVKIALYIFCLAALFDFLMEPLLRQILLSYDMNGIWQSGL